MTSLRERDCFVIPTVCRRHSVQILLLSISLEQAQIRLFVKVLRREGDSNPRNPFGVYTLSRRASSTTRASLLRRNWLARRNSPCEFGLPPLLLLTRAHEALVTFIAVNDRLGLIVSMYKLQMDSAYKLAHYTNRPAKVQKIFDICTIVCDFFLFFHNFLTKSAFALAVVTSFTCSGVQLYTCASRSATYHIQRLSLRLPR